MDIEQLKHSYQQKLVQAGIESHRIEAAVKNITIEELRLISEIWSQWALFSTENEAIAGVEAF